MKKWLLFLMGIVLVTSLSDGTCRRSPVHADNYSPQHTPAIAGNATELAYVPDASETADLAVAETETGQQSDRQDFRFFDRVLNIVDAFAKLVMVI